MVSQNKFHLLSRRFSFCLRQIIARAGLPAQKFPYLRPFSYTHPGCGVEGCAFLGKLPDHLSLRFGKVRQFG